MNSLPIANWRLPIANWPGGGSRSLNINNALATLHSNRQSAIGNWKCNQSTIGNWK